jgi:hypothetical protein
MLNERVAPKKHSGVNSRLGSNPAADQISSFFVRICLLNNPLNVVAQHVEKSLKIANANLRLSHRKATAKPSPSPAMG